VPFCAVAQRGSRAPSFRASPDRGAAATKFEPTSPLPPNRRVGRLVAVETRCSALIETRLCCRCLFASDPIQDQGGARSRAISDRMSANICRDAVTSAIRNVT
jgi:hypothetical protein